MQLKQFHVCKNVTRKFKLQKALNSKPSQSQHIDTKPTIHCHAVIQSGGSAIFS
jgi:hypothetical protein